MTNLCKIDTRALNPGQLADLRRRAISLVEAGETQGEVARLLHVRPATVCRWVSLKRQGGDDALVAVGRKGRRPGTTGRLSADQAATIVRLLIDNHPEQLKLPFALWTSAAVGDLIQERTGVRFSDRAVRQKLTSWGFSPQRPARRAVERDDEAVETWQRTTYPQIREEAKRRGAVAAFIDETGVRSDAACPRAWAPVGKTPVALGPGKRFGANVLIALLPTGEHGFLVYRERFRAPVLIDFLESLDRQCGERPMDIVMDNHSVHKCKAVKEWFAQRSPRLRAVFLPPYAPETNPVELANNDLKTNWLSPLRPRTPEELDDGLRTYDEILTQDRDRVRSFFEAEQTKYISR